MADGGQIKWHFSSSSSSSSLSSEHKRTGVKQEEAREKLSRREKNDDEKEEEWEEQQRQTFSSTRARTRTECLVAFYTSNTFFALSVSLPLSFKRQCISSWYGQFIIMINDWIQERERGGYRIGWIQWLTASCAAGRVAVHLIIVLRITS